MQEIAAAAAMRSEHEGLCAIDRSGFVDGVVLFRMVAGAVGTGELTCAVAREHSLAALLVSYALARFRDRNARLVCAEYPGTEDYVEYAQLLRGAGLAAAASIPDYFADGVPLLIASRLTR